jgi:actin-related protein
MLNQGNLALLLSFLFTEDWADPHFSLLSEKKNRVLMEVSIIPAANQRSKLIWIGGSTLPRLLIAQQLLCLV